MRYPGLSYIGSGKITGLYGLNETIHDQKSIGLQHLYIDDYKDDLIYCATTVVKVDDKCYFGDRIKPKYGHSLKQESNYSRTLDGFIFNDEFIYRKFKKEDKVFCYDDYSICFKSKVTNTSNEIKEFTFSPMVITTDNKFIVNNINKNTFVISLGHKEFYMSCNFSNSLKRISNDSPSGFMYHGIQDILLEENEVKADNFFSDSPIAMSFNKKVTLQPNESYEIEWFISKNKVKEQINYINNGINYWDKWLHESNIFNDKDNIIKTNLIALKAMNMNGFIPADLTGHYFASNNVSFYVRDALMASRAFLYSGHFDECASIINIIKKLPKKESSELYQRYNSNLVHDEGANNNVFSQIDVIGYYLVVIADYYHLTKNMLIETSEILRMIKILDTVKCKNKLYGPEGGVNEGVYGPAYITSTNIFIASGMLSAIYLLKEHGMDKEGKIIKLKFDELKEGIDSTFIDNQYYGYGYVSYHDDLIKRYDTPQLFGASLGYPIDSKYRQNFKTLTNISTYYDYGYGYSEQEYHDGPWLFNTAFAAENAYLLDDFVLYNNIMNWIDEHKNKYGLLPEAISSRNESVSFINPLMWANAEYICAYYSYIIKELREGK
jgi:hypothetical protein